MIQLQRLLMSPNMELIEGNQILIEELFNRILFPLLDDLLKPEVYLRDAQGMPETRLRASALLCKTFMHFEVRESQTNVDIRVLWIQILDLLDRLMNIDKKDQLVSDVCRILSLLSHSMLSSVRAHPRVTKECGSGDARHKHTCATIGLGCAHRAAALALGSHARAYRPIFAGIPGVGDSGRSSGCVISWVDRRLCCTDVKLSLPHVFISRSIHHHASKSFSTLGLKEFHLQWPAYKSTLCDEDLDRICRDETTHLTLT
jgi:hypothetical protein